ncbi:hypothetical protein [uncultured Sphingomonas sp.]|uniref:hypothetical protein n=1 Tax=uncultured Sphingomonas sp. TaxID=158754 RepID=UPI00262A4318|nr:hypothetical protein [uncultured Sphingomonas sp.]
MRHAWIVAVGLLVSEHASARVGSTEATRAEFREAVKNYQMFVVPHCAPADVDAYVRARADRDRVFVQSLRRTKLAADYKRAVAKRARADRNTVFECMGPPPLPGAPAPTRAQIEQEHAASLQAFFAGGDRAFSEMVRLRDAVIDAKRAS